jgi:hypothetical protein
LEPGRRVQAHEKFSQESKTVEIEAQSLTTCGVNSDGGLILLSFVDTSGQPTTIRLSVHQAGIWAMTLPGLIDKALQTRFANDTLRYTYSLASWKIEQSFDPTQCMVTLRTADGFGVCFSIGRDQQRLLSEALALESHPVALRSN